MPSSLINQSSYLLASRNILSFNAIYSSNIPPTVTWLFLETEPQLRIGCDEGEI